MLYEQLPPNASMGFMLFLPCMSLFFSIFIVIIYSVHAHRGFIFICYIACMGGGVFRNIVYLSNPIIKTSYVKVYLNTIEQRHRNDVPDCFAHA